MKKEYKVENEVVIIPEGTKVIEAEAYAEKLTTSLF